MVKVPTQKTPQLSLNEALEKLKDIPFNSADLGYWQDLLTEGLDDNTRMRILKAWESDASTSAEVFEFFLKYDVVSGSVPPPSQQLHQPPSPQKRGFFEILWTPFVD